MTAATAITTNTITVSPANAALLSVGQLISSASFAAGTSISSINTSTGVVTLSTNATAAITSGTSFTFSSPDAVIFGKGSGAAGTVTVTGTQSATAMTINAAGSGNYTFTGGTINLGPNNGGSGILTLNTSATINSALINKGVSFASANQTLLLGGGSSSFMINGIAAGTTPAIALTSKLELTAGTYNQGGGQTNYNIGNVSTGTGGFVIDAGVIYNTAASFQAGNSTTAPGLIVLNGGTINQTGGNSVIGRGAGTTGRVILNSGSYNHTSAANSLLVAFQGATGTLDVQGTAALNVTNVIALNSPGGSAGAGGTAVVNISGNSVATVAGINFGKGPDFAGAASSGSGTLNVSGGTLYVGASGIAKSGTGTYTSAINLSGGIIGATANWTSDQPMTLTNTATFKAANAANVANNIGLSGVLSGSGNLTKTGGGVLTLSAANTYNGATTVSGGTLALDATGTIANTSGVELAAATLDVSAKSGYTVNNLSGTGNVAGALSVSTQLSAGGGTTGAIAFNNALTLGASSTYLYGIAGGTANADLVTVAGPLTLTSGSILDLVQLGTYTAGQKFTLFAYSGALSGTFNGLADDSTFTDAGGTWTINYNDTSAGLNGGSGTGFVTITAAIPEPGSLLLGGLGLFGALLRRRRVA